MAPTSLCFLLLAQFVPNPFSLGIPPPALSYPASHRFSAPLTLKFLPGSCSPASTSPPHPVSPSAHHASIIVSFLCAFARSFSPSVFAQYIHLCTYMQLLLHFLSLLTGKGRLYSGSGDWKRSRRTYSSTDRRRG